ncbi:hypothetical protein CLF_110035 [Clonorchis sinensis]|uniref:Uncharacterized protein n=1 Tax=Clonorchis sinensis TaxID=79923 RepID=G7YK54_CLOSI|nr:hypothetical protein CLF_110035 [Clonorchis sinensis]
MDVEQLAVDLRFTVTVCAGTHQVGLNGTDVKLGFAAHPPLFERHGGRNLLNDKKSKSKEVRKKLSSLLLVRESLKQLPIDIKPRYTRWEACSRCYVEGALRAIGCDVDFLVHQPMIISYRGICFPQSAKAVIGLGLSKVTVSDLCLLAIVGSLRYPNFGIISNPKNNVQISLELQESNVYNRDDGRFFKTQYDRYSKLLAKLQKPSCRATLLTQQTTLVHQTGMPISRWSKAVATRPFKSNVLNNGWILDWFDRAKRFVRRHSHCDIRIPPMNIRNIVQNKPIEKLLDHRFNRWTTRLLSHKRNWPRVIETSHPLSEVTLLIGLLKALRQPATG